LTKKVDTCISETGTNRAGRGIGTGNKGGEKEMISVGIKSYFRLKEKYGRIKVKGFKTTNIGGGKSLKNKIWGVLEVFSGMVKK